MSQNNYNGVLQKPLGSGFNSSATTSEVIKGIKLDKKVAIVTGASTGIGLETVKTLSSAGASVIAAVRNIDKAKSNLQKLANVEIVELDLMSTDSIDSFAAWFLSTNRSLDLLINNAGIMFVPLRRDDRGIESQLATNYLSVFRLTSKLWDALKSTDHSRVLNISSQGHQFAPFNFEDPNFEKREFDSLSAYGQSKTALNLFTVELDNRAKEFGVRAYAIHPGNIWGTELAREASPETLQQMGFLDKNGEPIQEVIDSLKTVAQGAATTIWAATSPLLDTIGGVYLEDSDIAQIATEEGFTQGVRAYSLEEKQAKQLWDLSEKMTGLNFLS
ncbi:SDR family NAD(P)-dependent oxidoreductase [Galbibacter sp.]|uniref:SDR family NAD(P)-dependent oxidoreductase n=1 Tax=Galbibacter sp. TaxID=2918471 RepID=UPI002B5C2788|nr:SDR family NAD(P)-dependent oxidoreductase [Galbibacter sp.]HLV63651.1 SDR family NAD(P)-dependent oxidoreductase [Galbibacter sp.]